MTHYSSLSCRPDNFFRVWNFKEKVQNKCDLAIDGWRGGGKDNFYLLSTAYIFIINSEQIVLSYLLWVWSMMLTGNHTKKSITKLGCKTIVSPITAKGSA